MTLDAPTISVITSGFVAIATLLFPLIISLISDRLKWAREKKTTEIDHVEKATKALMDSLADLWGNNYYRGVLRMQTASMEDMPQLKSRTLSCFYDWERIICRYGTKPDQTLIKTLRQDFENFSHFTDESDTYRLSLSNNIHDIVYRTIMKI
jgi:hypothetical protein